MDLLREHLLAGSGLAYQNETHVARREARDKVTYARHARLDAVGLVLDRNDAHLAELDDGADRNVGPFRRNQAMPIDARPVGAIEILDTKGNAQGQPRMGP